MEIEKTINNWFEETFQLVKEKKPTSELACLLASCVLCADKYSRAILCLINNGHKLPAQALLRALVEFYIKLLWCTNVPNQVDIAEKEKHVHEKFRRWDFKRVIEHKKLLTSMLTEKKEEQDPEVVDAISHLEGQYNTYKGQKLRCMPDVASLFKKISDDLKEDDWKNIVYPKIYQNYSDAVHLDMRVVREFVKYDKDTNTIQWRADMGNSNDLLGYCASMSCDINQMIRNFYGWSSDKIREDYKEIDRFLRNC